MPNKTQEPLTPRGRLGLGLTLIAFGVMPMLATFDIGPLGPKDINGPAWLGVASGGVFVTGGLALIAGPDRKILNSLFGILAVAGLAAMGNWIAFGFGERVCGASILIWVGAVTGLGCRIPFGIGALITNAMVLMMIVIAVQSALGGPPRLSRLRKLTENVLLLALAPILLPLFLVTVLVAATGAIRTRLTTGQWPRNEAFIAKMKARREAR